MVRMYGDPSAPTAPPPPVGATARRDVLVLVLSAITATCLG